MKYDILSKLNIYRLQVKNFNDSYGKEGAFSEVFDKQYLKQIKKDTIAIKRELNTYLKTLK